MALDYFAPGVYVEEVDRGSRPIEGVSMSVAGFVGFTEDLRGDAELFKPMLITNWGQYLESFAKPGSPHPGFTDFDAYLPFAVQGWFDNGGGRCWVVSIGTRPPGAPAPAPEETATKVITSGGKPSLSFNLKPPEGDDAALPPQVTVGLPLWCPMVSPSPCPTMPPTMPTPRSTRGNISPSLLIEGLRNLSAMNI